MYSMKREMKYATKQEAFWAGYFGDDYIGRNAGPSLLAANTALFARILNAAPGIRSVIEYGPNTGSNLLAIRSLLPGAALTGVEINRKAASILRRAKGIEVFEGSILSFDRPGVWDLSFTKGVLIHIAPGRLHRAYDVLNRTSARYIAIAEYYSPRPAAVAYRGHRGKLFKRDFAGELLDRFPGLRLVDYGFVYHRDRSFPQDDLNWFVLEKTQKV
jgi:pseudaminic acid biosynthesis-associated methylase